MINWDFDITATKTVYGLPFSTKPNHFISKFIFNSFTKQLLKISKMMQQQPMMMEQQPMMMQQPQMMGQPMMTQQPMMVQPQIIMQQQQFKSDNYCGPICKAVRCCLFALFSLCKTIVKSIVWYKQPLCFIIYLFIYFKFYFILFSGWSFWSCNYS